ncbi:MAG: ABC transporter permease [Elusimicrobiota bacterium]|jgi:putative spermidine/putrescine transport system permease protein|nr:ABC transporter permease [Elusimicrobiota bacterium]
MINIKSRFPARFWNNFVRGMMAFFVINVLLIVFTVMANSFGNNWFEGFLPSGFTLKWYSQAWSEFQLGHVLLVTSEVVIAVVLFSVVLGVPAAYVMARKNFPGKSALMFLFLLPMMIPPVTYGIPMATVMYKYAVGGTLLGVIMANMVPALPFIILVMTPFIEQIDENLENAAKVFGAGTLKTFWHVLVPLLGPGILASSLLVLVRTISMFELTFMTAGPDNQTLVVALFTSMNAAGVRPQQLTDAMAMIYMVITLIWLLVALQFVNPTQLVSRVKEVPQD